MRLRVPAGVTVGGRGIGGRFVSVDMLPALASESDDVGALLLLELAAREADKAANTQARIERKFQDDPRRYAVARQDAETRREGWESAVDQIASLLEEPEPDEPQEFADEWEIGFDYNGAAGRASDVDINIRLRRMDGAEFPASEAMAALRAFRDNLKQGIRNPVPLGYYMASINWRRPHSASGWRPRGMSGTQSDLENFDTVLYSQADNEMAWDVTATGPVRLGSVKP